MKLFLNYQIKISLLLVLVLSGCSSAVKFSSNTAKYSAEKPPSNNTKAETSNFSVGSVFRGYASYYGDKFHNRITASGEPFNQNDLTAAHRTLPFGTLAKVTNLSNGKSVVVRINDRGPNVEGRIIDLSKESAKQIEMLEQGVTEVEILILYLP